MKKILAVSVLFAMSIATNASEIKLAKSSDFRELSQSHLKQSPNISASQINLIGENQNKDSVSYALGAPHFSTGILPAKKWEYRFNVVNGDEIVEDCSYRLDFENNQVNTVTTNSQKCVDILAAKQQPIQVIEKVVPQKVEKSSLRGIERAEARFALNKFDKKNITNHINWDKLVKEIKQNKPERVYLSAHTDSKGSYLYNMELASKRADTIAKELIDRGVNPSIIEINNVGKTETFSERKVVVSW